MAASQKGEKTRSKAGAKKKKRNPWSIFFGGFLKSIMVIGGICVVGFASYKLTWMYYDMHGGPERNATSKKISELYGKVDLGETPIHLIYDVDQTGQIKAMVLELLNTSVQRVDYVTVPLRSQFEISNELYQKLCASGCEAPQIIKLSKIDEYFENSTLYEYGVLLLEDVLDVDIDYYTAMPSEDFERLFVKKKPAEPVYNDTGEEIQSYVEYRLTDGLLQKAGELSGEELEDLAKKFLEDCESNLGSRQKLELLESYQQAILGAAYVHSLYGSLSDKLYTLDVENCDKLIRAILDNQTIGAGSAVSSGDGGSEEEGEQAVSSAGRSIEILNGSKINGLAASYQEQLTQAGYTVHGIGNYEGELVSTTKIVTSDPSYGQDLLMYFPSASIETGELPEGIELQIILGTDAS